MTRNRHKQEFRCDNECEHLVSHGFKIYCKRYDKELEGTYLKADKCYQCRNENE